VTVFDVRPPGFCTEINAAPAPLIRVAGIKAVNRVGLTKPVARSCEPVPEFQRTTAPLAKSVPLMSIWVAPDPAVAEVADSEVITGTVPETLVIAKLTELDAAPPGLTTVISAAPGVAINAAGTRAVSCVEEFTPVVSGCGPPPAFQVTTVPVWKLVPATANSKPALPAVTVFGVSPPVLIVGVTLGVIVNVSEFETAPPGLTAEISAVPVLVNRLAGTMAVTCVGETKPVLNGIAVPPASHRN